MTKSIEVHVEQFLNTFSIDLNYNQKSSNQSNCYLRRVSGRICCFENMFQTVVVDQIVDQVLPEFWNKAMFSKIVATWLDCCAVWKLNDHELELFHFFYLSANGAEEFKVLKTFEPFKVDAAQIRIVTESKNSAERASSSPIKLTIYFEIFLVFVHSCLNFF